MIIASFIVLTFAGTATGRNPATPSNVPTSAEDINPLPVGAEMPQLILKTVDGKSFDLNAAVADKPTILIFFRGEW